MNGAFHLDESWHHAWEAAAALIATTGATARNARGCRPGRRTGANTLGCGV